jgi:hypothetical protein
LISNSAVASKETRGGIMLASMTAWNKTTSTVCLEERS